MEHELDEAIFSEHLREFEEVSSNLSLEDLEAQDTALLDSFCL